MKNLKKYSLATLVIVAIMFTGIKCTKHDQVLNQPPTPSTPASSDTLFCVQGTANVLSGNSNNTYPTVWNGSLDAAWSNAPAITVNAVVPDLGNNTFTGFIGNSTSVTMQSMYDANNIYFLFQWNAKKKGVYSSPWYFDTTNHVWAQMTAAPVYDINGIMTRPSFLQDQFTVAFDIANSCASFKTGGCFGVCHVNSPTLTLDTASGLITSTPNYGGAMYTNGPIEKLDCWRVRSIQALNAHQGNDTYFDWGSGAINVNQLHNDPQSVASDGGGSNKQSIGGVNVPKYIYKTMPGGYNGGVMVGDTSFANGPAYKVIAVSSTGVLTLSDGTTIDPTNDPSYQTVGTGANMTLGSNCIAGTIVGAYSGSRGNVTANMYWTGSGWKLLVKRALKTSDILNQDVDFSGLADQPFGLGVMFDGADNEHAVASGLILHFNK